MTEISGVIFPIPLKPLQRILNKERDVFFKFSRMNKLKPGMTLHFYSTFHKKILGEAKIVEVENLNVSKMIEKYKYRIFLEPDEIRIYCSFGSKWRSKPRSNSVLVLILENIQKYDTYKNASNRVNVSGFYIK